MARQSIRQRRGLAALDFLAAVEGGIWERVKAAAATQGISVVQADALVKAAQLVRAARRGRTARHHTARRASV